MDERILNMLTRFRRRLLAVRAAEAAAVGGAAGALVAAVLMVGRIVVEGYPYAAAALCAAPLAGGVVLAGWGRARRRLSSHAMLQWFVTVLAALCGAAAVVCVGTGVLLVLPKNALFLIAPAGAAAAAAIVLAQGVSLKRVAILLDRRAGLSERLSTAWELHQAGTQSPFAVAVQRQAAAGGTGLSAVRLWDRTRATLGALGLAAAAAALMLPWSPLESPAARQQRQWRQVGPSAGERLRQELEALKAGEIPAGKDLARQLQRLEALTKVLRSARPADAGKWQGTVVELDRIAEALRAIRRSGAADPATDRRIARLLHAIEEAAADLAGGMGGRGGWDHARSGSEGADPATIAPPAPPPTGWTTVFNRDYVDLVRATTSTAPGTDDGAATPAPQVPYDGQWAAARARAAKALRRGDVPREYRQLVRDFFGRQ